jgi:GNAT superfamily N-acetyltransferase
LRIIQGFDEKALYLIAKESGSKQLKDDVKYMRLPSRKGIQVAAERLDDVAFWIGYHNKDHLRLVGIGVKRDQQNKRYGRFMLKRAIEYAKVQGFNKVRTRTLNGVDFYQKWGGAKIVGYKGNDYIMEIDV